MTAHRRGEGSLSGRTATAAQWRFGLSATQAAFQFGVGIVLARLLPPEDFGLLALAMIVAGFARFASNLGLAPAIIQRAELTDRHVRVAFTLSVVLGLAVFGVIFALAPLSAPLFQNDRVPDVLRGISVMFVATGLGNTAGALLRRDLDFRRIFWIVNISDLLGYGLLSVVLAFSGYGVWSLVIGTVTQKVLESALLLFTTGHSLKPLVSLEETRDITGYGVGFTLGGLAEYLGRTGDNFVTGRWLGSHALGIYSRAYGLMMLPQDYLSSIIEQVLFPAFSEVQEDRSRLGTAYLLAVQLVTLIAAPVMVGMVVAAPHMIVGLYGEKWSATVLPLQILCAVGSLRAIYPLAGSVARATGDVYPFFWRAIGYTVLVLGGAYVGTRWGVPGVAGAVAGAVLFVYLAMAQLSLRLLPYRWKDFWSFQGQGLLVAAVVGAVALGVRWTLEGAGAGHLVIFAAIVAACSVTLPSAVYLLPASIRPDRLFDRIEEVSRRWPGPMRTWIGRFLRRESDAGASA